MAMAGRRYALTKAEEPFELKPIAEEETTTRAEDFKQQDHTTSFTSLRPSKLRQLAPIIHIEYSGFNFLITQMPDEDTLPQYIEVLKMHNVTAVARVCNATYKARDILDEGIEVRDFTFNDETGPPQMIVDDWLNLVVKHNSSYKKTCIGVHCGHGMGRAQMMVGLVLMELGLRFEEAVKGIKTRRRDAMNESHLHYLENYSICQKMRFSILYYKKVGYALIRK